MTTFEITIIVLLVAIVLLLMWLIVLTRNNYLLNQTKELKRQQQVESLLSHLKTMRERSMLLLTISDRLEIHSDNCINRLAELTDIVDKMHRNLCVEIADKMVDRVYKQPTSVNGTPCYAPDGICTNPQMDCINCPKRGTGGTWSTSININNEG